MVVWCVFWGEGVGTAFPFSQDLRAPRARHLSVSVASSWDTEEEEREEEVGGAGRKQRGKEERDNEKRELGGQQVLLGECCGLHDRGSRVGHACRCLMRAWLLLREFASMGHK